MPIDPTAGKSQKLPKPAENVRGSNTLEPAGPSFETVAKMYKPKNVGVETPKATVSRYALFLIDQETGDALHAGEIASSAALAAETAARIAADEAEAAARIAGDLAGAAAPYDLGEWPNILGAGLVIDPANGPIQIVRLTGATPANVTIIFASGPVEGSSVTLYVSSATADTEISLSGGVSVPSNASSPVVLAAFNASYIIEFRGIGYLWTMTEIKGPFPVD